MRTGMSPCGIARIRGLLPMRRSFAPHGGMFGIVFVQQTPMYPARAA